MKSLTLLVLARPTDRHLAMLERLPEDTRIVTGDRPEAFSSAASEADALLAWFTNRELLELVFKMAPRIRWVHVSSTGLDSLLFPELAESPALLTNARGAFSWSLAEFALAAVLFFAKGLRRLVRSQEAGT